MVWDKNLNYLNKFIQLKVKYWYRDFCCILISSIESDYKMPPILNKLEKVSEMFQVSC